MRTSPMLNLGQRRDLRAEEKLMWLNSYGRTSILVMEWEACLVGINSST